MRRLVASLAFCFVVSLICAHSARAVRLEGRVRSVDGMPVAHLALVVTGPSGSLEALTGPGGRFELADLTPGRYAVASRSDRFEVRSGGSFAVGESDLRLEVVVGPAPYEEAVVVTATRDEAARSSVGFSASLLDAETIRSREAPALLDLLRELPGLTVARAGGVGAQGSVFVRGGESDFTRVLVDGVPVNQPGGAFDLGAALPLDLERVELVRGAASSLYGSDALAGVLHLVTRRARPDAPASLRVEAEGGSDSWRRYLVGGAGATGSVDWSLGVQDLTTEGEVPNRGYDGQAGALAAGWSSGDSASVRLTLRASDGSAGTPGPTRFGRPDLDASFDRQDVAGGVTTSIVAGRSEHELRLGWADGRQLSLDPEDSGPWVPSDGERTAPFTYYDFPNPLGYQNESDRLTLGWRLGRQLGEGHLLAGGLDWERETGAIGDRREPPLLAPVRRNAGYWLQDRWLVSGSLSLTLGARLEDNASFGSKVVPRVALAWDAGRAGVLRGSAAAGIKEPSFLESYGVSFFSLGNPDLDPERSRTWDLGWERRFEKARTSVEVVAYHHLYEDQIAYQLVDPETFQGSFVNLGESRARGVELSFRSDPLDWLHVVAHYTWLDGEILVSGDVFDPVYAEGAGLLRRPEHEGVLIVEGHGRRFGVGGSLFLVGPRTDSDFLSLGLTRNPGYVRLDLRGRASVGRDLELFAALDNAADEGYEEALGYPAPGRTVRAGVSFRWGG